MKRFRNNEKLNPKIAEEKRDTATEIISFTSDENDDHQMISEIKTTCTLVKKISMKRIHVTCSLSTVDFKQCTLAIPITLLVIITFPVCSMFSYYLLSCIHNMKLTSSPSQVIHLLITTNTTSQPKSSTMNFPSFSKDPPCENHVVVKATSSKVTQNSKIIFKEPNSNDDAWKLFKSWKLRPNIKAEKQNFSSKHIFRRSELRGSNEFYKNEIQWTKFKPG